MLIQGNKTGYVSYIIVLLYNIICLLFDSAEEEQSPAADDCTGATTTREEYPNPSVTVSSGTPITSSISPTPEAGVQDLG